VYLIHTITYEIKFNAIKSAERFSGCLRVLIHCLMPTFREHCSSLHRKATWYWHIKKGFSLQSFSSI